MKCKQALRKTGLTRLAVGGGVSANKPLRAALEAMCAKEGAELFIPPLSLCTDNAAMAALAVEKWKRGEFAAAGPGRRAELPVSGFRAGETAAAPRVLPRARPGPVSRGVRCRRP